MYVLHRKCNLLGPLLGPATGGVAAGWDSWDKSGAGAGAPAFWALTPGP